MITEISAFLATTVGKLVAGTAVAAVSVGGAHAAQVIDVPLLPDSPAAVTLVTDDGDDVADDSANSDVAVVATDTATESESEAIVGNEADDAAEEESVEIFGQDDRDGETEESEADTAADDEGDEDEDDEDDSNHGSVVSEFAHTTELEGCERGQAIAEIASSNAAEHRQNGERDKDKCGSDDETEDETDTTDEAATDTAVIDLAPDTVVDPVVEPPAVEVADTNGNRPDHAGPPENAGGGRPDHAGSGRGNK